MESTIMWITALTEIRTLLYLVDFLGNGTGVNRAKLQEESQNTTGQLVPL